ncbi:MULTISPECIES: hypothetical protein [unclassified Ensifer]|uniref:hypothetical protein n=1 Tax=unclassified Ensifer TaxID=2633371 RepID=UPI000813A2A8|nr:MULTISPECIES: hypothetical protein [unclassified Ensifer]OCP19800.1 hypothetical protein BC363_30340 [Ensifer sp. LC384]OCP19836.1 hypothetical protein BC361_29745 [Ensifer sp. LC54]
MRKTIIDEAVPGRLEAGVPVDTLCRAIWIGIYVHFARRSHIFLTLEARPDGKGLQREAKFGRLGP